MVLHGAPAFTVPPYQFPIGPSKPAGRHLTSSARRLPL